jgi:hypothetical protein
MKKYIVSTLGLISLFAAVESQVQSLKISGSFNGSFLLSNTPEPYQIAGSPYLSENWMYGTIEIKSEVTESSSLQSKRRKTLLEQAVHRCDLLIEKISDPRYRTEGISLILEKVESEGEEDLGEGEKNIEEVEILHHDFKDLEQLTGKFESDLLGYLTLLRARYEAQIDEIEKINGLFRYNLYAQEFEMIYDRDTFAIIAPFNVRSISVSNMKFIHGFYVEESVSRLYLGSSYFQVMNDGECKLLVRHAVKIRGGGAPVTYNWANAEGDAFVQFEQLFYQVRDGSEIRPLKKRKSALRDLFGERYEKVMLYMKTEDLSLKKSEDLARMFSYYNLLDS